MEQLIIAKSNSRPKQPKAMTTTQGNDSHTSSYVPSKSSSRSRSTQLNLKAVSRFGDLTPHGRVASLSDKGSWWKKRRLQCLSQPAVGMCLQRHTEYPVTRGSSRCQTRHRTHSTRATQESYSAQPGVVRGFCLGTYSSIHRQRRRRVGMCLQRI